jgi:hypothetical protein
MCAKLLAGCSPHGRTCERDRDKHSRCKPPVRLQGLLFSHHVVLGRHKVRHLREVNENWSSLYGAIFRISCCKRSISRQSLVANFQYPCRAIRDPVRSRSHMVRGDEVHVGERANMPARGFRANNQFGAAPWRIQPISATSRAHASRLATLCDGRGPAFRGPKRGIRPPRQKEPNHVRTWQGGSGSSSARCGKSRSFAYPVISPLRRLVLISTLKKYLSLGRKGPRQ